MTKEYGSWDHIQYVDSKFDYWGDRDNVNPMLPLLMDRFRSSCGCPITINCSADSEGHKPNGDHPKGNGVDFHMKSMSKKERFVFVDYLSQIRALDDYLKSTRVFRIPVDQIIALGIYPQWKNPGFHLGIRGYKARWGWLDGKQVSFEEAYKYVEREGL